MNKDDALLVLEKLAEPAVLTLPSDASIGHHSQDHTYVYIVQSGLALRCKYTEQGERQVCRVYRPGDPIGLEMLAVTDPSLVIETIAPSVIKRIPIQRIRLAQQNDARTQSAVTSLLASEVMDGQQLKISFGTGSAMRRICRFLLWSAHNDLVSLPNREKLGNIVATTTETASRMIANLRREGAIIRNPRMPSTMRIDRDKLCKVAGDPQQQSAA
ncbi:Crp/Fnr family transcriptional regulator [Thalassospira indica]|uniref:Crp/Fnr family transcriptional regulator n=1 Tax=Thalassospira indica TaxID=1891279 RepID=A0ABN5NMI9_9PROT|nr:Crp/Fnr family transcriptional regulator [Thalassospira indica]AXO15694.1 Crp/Fnr family transcriptional regulator [Thalassospira indica]OAZ14104.1 Crp/Fnr family transcriptional regulator [Thalassospira profundimaris]